MQAVWGRGIVFGLSLAAGLAAFAGCGDSGGSSGGDGGAGGTGGVDASTGGAPDGSAPCSNGEFRCVGDKLETCAADLSGFQPVATCKAGLCDAPGKQCDNCVPGEGSCNSSGDGYTACDSTGQTEETVTCSTPKPFCIASSGSPACVECKAATDCPPSTNECQVSSCSAEGACGLSPVAKDAPCGASGAGGKCDGAGACVYCQPGEKRCTGLVPETCDAKGQWTSGNACAVPSPLCVAGSCVQCQAPTDCPTTTNECLSVACTNSQCGFSPKAQGTACASNAGTCNGAGQCNVCTPGSKTCNGNVPLVCGNNGQYTSQPACSGGTPNCDPATGNCVQCTSATQCPAATSPCLQATCGSGTCGFGNKPDTTACSVGGDNGTCAAGVCKVCNTGQTRCKSGSTNTLQTCDSNGQWQDSTCASGTPICSNGACTATLCPNGTVEAGEQCDDNNNAKCDGCEGCEKRNWLNVPASAYATIPGLQAKMPTGNACYEVWAKHTALTDAVYLSSTSDAVHSNVILRCLYGTLLQFATQNGSGSSLLTYTQPSAPCGNNQWHHVAGCRAINGSQVTLTLFFDGQQVGSGTGTTASIATPALPIIGGVTYDKPGLGGSIDELRVSDTIRYTGAFTPARRFSVDGNTVALFHFDEGTGATATDSSANALTATLTGTSWSPDTGYTTAMCQ